jgi:hypothetical protein
MALLLAAPQVSVTEVKSKSPRHSPFRNPASPTEEESLCALTCALAGARFTGIQKAAPEVGLKALCLFNCPACSTLAVPVDELMAERVRYEIYRSNLRFAGFSESELADPDRFHAVIELPTRR